MKARDVAIASDYPKVHVGCVAVYKGKIIGVGCNQNKTHPTQRYYNKFRIKNNYEYLPPKLHAEINCINSIKHLHINFSKVKIYVYRICNKQPYGISRPCPSCMAAIKKLGIHKIYYTTDSGYTYEELKKGS